MHRKIFFTPLASAQRQTSAEIRSGAWPVLWHLCFQPISAQSDSAFVTAITAPFTPTMSLWMDFCFYFIQSIVILSDLRCSNSIPGRDLQNLIFYMMITSMEIYSP